MWSIVVPLILFFIVCKTFVKVIIYGESILRPNFRRVDEKFTARIGFNSYWNTTFGKIVYYLMPMGLLLMITVLIRLII